MPYLDEIRAPRHAAGPARPGPLARRDRRGPASAPSAPGLPGGGTAVPPPGTAIPVTVAVLADDSLTEQGAVAYLRAHPGTTPLTPAGVLHADVALVLGDAITEETLAWMQAAADQAPGQQLRFVMVSDQVHERQLLRAVAMGLVSVLPRQGTDYQRIVQAILAVRDGRVEMPEIALGWLAGQLRLIHRNVLQPHGLTAAGLESREVDVLRLLADGLDTAEIAERLNYSQRTVKNIVHGMLVRLKLRNRSHAVAFALRHGLL